MFRVSPRNHWSQAKALASVALVAAVLGLAGCGSSPTNRAPVEDRGSSAGAARPSAGASAPVAAAPAAGAAGSTGAPAASGAKVLPGAENEGKPGYYTVKPGDTLIRIGLDNGQNWRDVVRWNGIENPNQIEVGQVLRVQPPLAGATSVAAAPAARAAAPAGAASGVVTRPVASSSATPTPVPPAGASAPAAASAAVAAVPSSEEDLGWIWPTSGTVLAGFDEVKNKGLDIGGAAGSPVVAAADGRVVYVGAGLRGYGNLIILKHNNTYLTAYAHNQALLVKEDQAVRRGQKIAEMGSSDTDRVKLHFEVRRQGKPVDPAKYLPPR